MKEFFERENIELYAYVPLERCKVIKSYLLEKNGFDSSCGAVMMLLPYRSDIKPKNLSVYASVRDYHKYAEELEKRFLEYAKNRYGDGKFKLFADHSPIDEVHAACICGLGFIGRNGLLINEKYSSFVFLCEIVTNLTEKELGIPQYVEKEPRTCINCGACVRACPSNCMDERDPRPKTECMSAITQKKGALTEEEITKMIENSCIWGCDICQNVCPYTKNADVTPISYFREDVITELTTEILDGMTDEEFKSRPFSWRGREVVRRNAMHFCERREKSEE